VSEVVRIRASGIDSLYASVRGQLADELLVTLAALRSDNPGADVPVALQGVTPDFLLRRYGWRGYPLWLSSPRFEVCLGGSDPFPPVYLQLHAEHIHSLGIDAAVGDAESFLVGVLFPRGCHVVASRVDVFVDEQGWTPRREDSTRFRCLARRRRMFEVSRQEHGYGRRLSGFTFGKGDLVARIYDKSLEMAVVGATWPELLWKGRDSAQAVWRVEYQFRRPALAAMGLTGMRDVVRHRQALWDYGCRWLSLRSRISDTNLARWPVAPVWTQLASACIGGSGVALIRERVHQADVLRLTQGLVGYATSLEAADGARGLGPAIRSTVPSVDPYLAQRGVAFGQLVMEKRSRRLGADG